MDEWTSGMIDAPDIGLVAPRPAAEDMAQPSARGLWLPAIVLLGAWILALMNGTRNGVEPNAVLSVSSTAYCLLLGCSLTLFREKRRQFGSFLLLFCAWLSAMSLGWAKLLTIGSDMNFFSMPGVAQLWLDFLVALIPAALVVLCALVPPLLLKGNAGYAAELCGGGAVCICSAVTMLMTIPAYSILTILFSLFASLILGACTAAAALFTGRAKLAPKRRIALSGGGVAWFSLCIPFVLAACLLCLITKESYLPVFFFVLLLVQLVMLIILLCGRRKGYLWYAASAAAVFLAGLMYYLLAFALAATWLPIVLLNALICVPGPAVGYVFIRNRRQVEAEPDRQEPRVNP